MKKLTIIMGFISLLVVTYTAIKIKVRIDKLENCTYSYYFVDTNGNVGNIRHCFTKDGKKICRFNNNNKIVREYKKVEVCK